MHKLKIMRVCYPDIQVRQWQARQIRGFFADRDPQDSLLHQHLQDGTTAYRYPLVQYKVLHGHPVVIAANDGIDALYRLVMQRDTLILNGVSHPCGNRQIQLGEEPIGPLGRPAAYRFLAPWFALNQANFQRYMTLDPEGQEALLGRILIGNILSLSKSFGISVEHTLAVSTRLTPRRTQFKGEGILSFTGTFTVNFRLPNLLGIGKSVSRGYGTVTAICQDQK